MRFLSKLHVHCADKYCTAWESQELGARLSRMYVKASSGRPENPTYLICTCTICLRLPRQEHLGA